MEDIEMSSNDQPDTTILDSRKPLKFQKSTISCITECESSHAQRICIFDIAYKLNNADEYDIGGTYRSKIPELWFYMKTTVCPNDNVLLNLFICHRNIGFFSVGISNSNNLRGDAKYEDYCFLPEDLTWKSFKSLKCDQCHYIKSFNLKKSDIVSLNDKALIIPIKLEITSHFKLNNAIVERVQAKHNIGSILKKEKTDFILESATHNKFPTHKIVLCTHSSVLRDLIKNTTADSMFLDISDELIELLLEFLYSGTIQDIIKYDNDKLLELAEKFKLNRLYPLIESAMKKKISVDNVLDIAKLSQKYQLQDVENYVFKFFRRNPQVLQTDAWKNLNDIVLTKKLFEHVYFEK